jgi:CBS domain-containing protein
MRDGARGGSRTMTLREICTRDVAVALASEDIVTAAQRMRRSHVGDLVVVEEVGGRKKPIGLITDRDIVVAVVAEGVRYLEQCTVGDAMTNRLLVAPEDSSFEDALARMSANGVRRLPLVDADGSLSGIVSFDDILALMSDELMDVARLISRARQREQIVRK